MQKKTNFDGCIMYLATPVLFGDPGAYGSIFATNSDSYSEI